jgi:hypothetical protein
MNGEHHFTCSKNKLGKTGCRMCVPWMHVSDSTRLDSIAAVGALVIDEVSFCSARVLGHFEHRISNPRERADALDLECGSRDSH